MSNGDSINNRNNKDTSQLGDWSHLYQSPEWLKDNAPKDSKPSSKEPNSSQVTFNQYVAPWTNPTDLLAAEILSSAKINLKYVDSTGRFNASDKIKQVKENLLAQLSSDSTATSQEEILRLLHENPRFVEFHLLPIPEQRDFLKTVGLPTKYAKKFVKLEVKEWNDQKRLGEVYKGEGLKLASEGRYGEASLMIEQAITYQPQDVFLRLSAASWFQNSFKEFSHLPEVAKLLSEKSNSHLAKAGENLQRQLQEADQLADHGKLDQAEKSYRQVIKDYESFRGYDSEMPISAGYAVGLSKAYREGATFLSERGRRELSPEELNGEKGKELSNKIDQELQKAEFSLNGTMKTLSEDKASKELATLYVARAAVYDQMENVKGAVEDHQKARKLDSTLTQPWEDYPKRLKIYADNFQKKREELVAEPAKDPKKWATLLYVVQNEIAVHRALKNDAKTKELEASFVEYSKKSATETLKVALIKRVHHASGIKLSDYSFPLISDPKMLRLAREMTEGDKNLTHLVDGVEFKAVAGKEGAQEISFTPFFDTLTPEEQKKVLNTLDQLATAREGAVKEELARKIKEGKEATAKWIKEGSLTLKQALADEKLKKQAETLIVKNDQGETELGFNDGFEKLTSEEKLKVLTELDRLGAIAHHQRLAAEELSQHNPNNPNDFTHYAQHLYHSGKVALLQDRMAEAQLKLRELKTVTAHRPELLAMRNETIELLRNLNLEGVAKLRSAAQDLMSQRIGHLTLSGKEFHIREAYQLNQLLDGIEYLILHEDGIDTIDEALAVSKETLVAKSKQFHAEFWKNPVAKENWSIKMEEGHSQIKLEGGTVEIPKAELGSQKEFTVQVGKNGGAIRTSKEAVVMAGGGGGGSYVEQKVYVFPPSDREQTIIVKGGIPQIPDAVAYQERRFEEKPLGEEIEGVASGKFEMGHPEILDTVLEWNEGKIQDKHFAILLREEMKQGLEEVQSTEESRAKAFELMKSMRGTGISDRNGSYTLAAQIAESEKIFGKELNEVLSKIDPLEVRAIVKEVEEERDQIANKVEARLKHEKETKPNSWIKQYPDGKGPNGKGPGPGGGPSPREKEKMVAEAIQAEIAQRLRAKAFKTLDNLFANGWYKDPVAKEGWDIYRSMMDPTNDLFTISDAGRDAIVDEVVTTAVTAPIMVGTGMAVRAGLRGTSLAIRWAAQGGAKAFIADKGITLVGSALEGVASEAATAHFFTGEMHLEGTGHMMLMSLAFHEGGKIAHAISFGEEGIKATRGMVRRAAKRTYNFLAHNASSATVDVHANQAIDLAKSATKDALGMLNEPATEDKSYAEKWSAAAIRMVGFHYGNKAFALTSIGRGLAHAEQVSQHRAGVAREHYLKNQAKDSQRYSEVSKTKERAKAESKHNLDEATKYAKGRKLEVSAHSQVIDLEAHKAEVSAGIDAALAAQVDRSQAEAAETATPSRRPEFTQEDAKVVRENWVKEAVKLRTPPEQIHALAAAVQEGTVRISRDTNGHPKIEQVSKESIQSLASQKQLKATHETAQAKATEAREVLQSKENDHQQAVESENQAKGLLAQAESRFSVKERDQLSQKVASAERQLQEARNEALDSYGKRRDAETRFEVAEENHDFANAQKGTDRSTLSQTKEELEQAKQALAEAKSQEVRAERAEEEARVAVAQAVQAQNNFDIEKANRLAPLQRAVTVATAATKSSARALEQARRESTHADQAAESAWLAMGGESNQTTSKPAQKSSDSVEALSYNSDGSSSGEKSDSQSQGSTKDQSGDQKNDHSSHPEETVLQGKKESVGKQVDFSSLPQGEVANDNARELTDAEFKQQLKQQGRSDIEIRRLVIERSKQQKMAQLAMTMGLEGQTADGVVPVTGTVSTTAIEGAVQSTTTNGEAHTSSSKKASTAKPSSIGTTLDPMTVISDFQKADIRSNPDYPTGGEHFASSLELQSGESVHHYSEKGEKKYGSYRVMLNDGTRAYRIVIGESVTVNAAEPITLASKDFLSCAAMVAKGTNPETGEQRLTLSHLEWDHPQGQYERIATDLTHLANSGFSDLQVYINIDPSAARQAPPREGSHESFHKFPDPATVKSDLQQKLSQRTGRDINVQLLKVDMASLDAEGKAVFRDIYATNEGVIVQSGREPVQVIKFVENGKESSSRLSGTMVPNPHYTVGSSHRQNIPVEWVNVPQIGREIGRGNIPSEEISADQLEPVGKIFEAPLVAAGELLREKGINSVSSTANTTKWPYTNIVFSPADLSEVNRAILIVEFNASIESMPWGMKGKDQDYIFVEVDATHLSPTEVSDRYAQIAHRLKPQKIPTAEERTIREINLGTGKVYSLGRSERSDIIINDRTVEANHLSIRLNDDGTVTVTNLVDAHLLSRGTSFGTDLQKRGDSFVVSPGEQLAIGDGITLHINEGGKLKIEGRLVNQSLTENETTQTKSQSAQALEPIPSDIQNAFLISHRTPDFYERVNPNPTDSAILSSADYPFQGFSQLIPVLKRDSRVSVGRGLGSDLVLIDSNRISSTHGRFYASQEGELYFQENEKASTNGTYIADKNGKIGKPLKANEIRKVYSVISFGGMPGEAGPAVIELGKHLRVSGVEYGSKVPVESSSSGASSGGVMRDVAFAEFEGRGDDSPIHQPGEIREPKSGAVQSIQNLHAASSGPGRVEGREAIHLFNPQNVDFVLGSTGKVHSLGRRAKDRNKAADFEIVTDHKTLPIKALEFKPDHKRQVIQVKNIGDADAVSPDSPIIQVNSIALKNDHSYELKVGDRLTITPSKSAIESYTFEVALSSNLENLGAVFLRRVEAKGAASPLPAESTRPPARTVVIPPVRSAEVIPVVIPKMALGELLRMGDSYPFDLQADHANPELVWIRAKSNHRVIYNNGEPLENYRVPRDAEFFVNGIRYKLGSPNEVRLPATQPARNVETVLMDAGRAVMLPSAAEVAQHAAMAVATPERGTKKVGFLRELYEKISPHVSRGPAEIFSFTLGILVAVVAPHIFRRVRKVISDRRLGAVEGAKQLGNPDQALLPEVSTVPQNIEVQDNFPKETSYGKYGALGADGKIYHADFSVEGKEGSFVVSPIAFAGRLGDRHRVICQDQAKKRFTLLLTRQEIDSLGVGNTDLEPLVDQKIHLSPILLEARNPVLGRDGQQYFISAITASDPSISPIYVDGINISVPLNGIKGRFFVGSPVKILEGSNFNENCMAVVFRGFFGTSLRSLTSHETQEAKEITLMIPRAVLDRMIKTEAGAISQETFAIDSNSLATDIVREMERDQLPPSTTQHGFEEDSKIGYTVSSPEGVGPLQVTTLVGKGIELGLLRNRSLTDSLQVAQEALAVHSPMGNDAQVPRLILYSIHPESSHFVVKAAAHSIVGRERLIPHSSSTPEMIVINMANFRIDLAEGVTGAPTLFEIKSHYQGRTEYHISRNAPSFIATGFGLSEILRTEEFKQEFLDHLKKELLKITNWRKLYNIQKPKIVADILKEFISKRSGKEIHPSVVLIKEVKTSDHNYALLAHAADPIELAPKNDDKRGISSSTAKSILNHPVTVAAVTGLLTFHSAVSHADNFQRVTEALPRGVLAVLGIAVGAAAGLVAGASVTYRTLMNYGRETEIIPISKIDTIDIGRLEGEPAQIFVGGKRHLAKFGFASRLHKGSTEKIQNGLTDSLFTINQTKNPAVKINGETVFLKRDKNGNLLIPPEAEGLKHFYPMELSDGYEGQVSKYGIYIKNDDGSWNRLQFGEKVLLKEGQAFAVGYGPGAKENLFLAYHPGTNQLIHYGNETMPLSRLTEGPSFRTSPSPRIFETVIHAKEGRWRIGKGKILNLVSESLEGLNENATVEGSNIKIPLFVREENNLDTDQIEVTRVKNLKSGELEIHVENLKGHPIYVADPNGVFQIKGKRCYLLEPGKKIVLTESIHELEIMQGLDFIDRSIVLKFYDTQETVSGASIDALADRIAKKFLDELKSHNINPAKIHDQNWFKYQSPHNSKLVAGGADSGIKDHNEDTVAISADGSMIAVFDGAGGAGGGELAGRIAELAANVGESAGLPLTDIFHLAHRALWKAKKDLESRDINQISLGIQATAAMAKFTPRSEGGSHAEIVKVADTVIYHLDATRKVKEVIGGENWISGLEAKLRDPKVIGNIDEIRKLIPEAIFNQYQPDQLVNHPHEIASAMRKGIRSSLGGDNVIPYDGSPIHLVLLPGESVQIGTDGTSKTMLPADIEKINQRHLGEGADVIQKAILVEEFARQLLVQRAWEKFGDTPCRLTLADYQEAYDYAALRHGFTPKEFTEADFDYHHGHTLKSGEAGGELYDPQGKLIMVWGVDNLSYAVRVEPAVSQAVADPVEVRSVSPHRNVPQLAAAASQSLVQTILASPFRPGIDFPLSKPKDHVYKLGRHPQSDLRIMEVDESGQVTDRPDRSISPHQLEVIAGVPDALSITVKDVQVLGDIYRRQTVVDGVPLKPGASVVLKLNNYFIIGDHFFTVVANELGELFLKRKDQSRNNANGGEGHLIQETPPEEVSVKILAPQVAPKIEPVSEISPQEVRVERAEPPVAQRVEPVAEISPEEVRVETAEPPVAPRVESVPEERAQATTEEKSPAAPALREKLIAVPPARIAGVTEAPDSIYPHPFDTANHGMGYLVLKRGSPTIPEIYTVGRMGDRDILINSSLILVSRHSGYFEVANDGSLFFVGPNKASSNPIYVSDENGYLGNRLVGGERREVTRFVFLGGELNDKNVALIELGKHIRVEGVEYENDFPSRSLAANGDLISLTPEEQGQLRADYLGHPDSNPEGNIVELRRGRTAHLRDAENFNRSTISALVRWAPLDNLPEFVPTDTGSSLRTANFRGGEWSRNNIPVKKFMVLPTATSPGERVMTGAEAQVGNKRGEVVYYIARRADGLFFLDIGLADSANHRVSKAEAAGQGFSDTGGGSGGESSSAPAKVTTSTSRPTTEVTQTFIELGGSIEVENGANHPTLYVPPVDKAALFVIGENDFIEAGISDGLPSGVSRIDATTFSRDSDGYLWIFHGRQEPSGWQEGKLGTYYFDIPEGSTELRAFQVGPDGHRVTDSDYLQLGKQIVFVRDYSTEKKSPIGSRRVSGAASTAVALGVAGTSYLASVAKQQGTKAFGVKLNRADAQKADVKKINETAQPLTGEVAPPPPPAKSSYKDLAIAGAGLAVVLAATLAVRSRMKGNRGERKISGDAKNLKAASPTGPSTKVIVDKDRIFEGPITKATPIQLDSLMLTLNTSSSEWASHPSVPFLFTVRNGRFSVRLSERVMSETPDALIERVTIKKPIETISSGSVSGEIGTPEKAKVDTSISVREDHNREGVGQILHGIQPSTLLRVGEKIYQMVGGSPRIGVDISLHDGENYVVISPEKNSLNISTEQQSLDNSPHYWLKITTEQSQEQSAPALKVNDWSTIQNKVSANDRLVRESRDDGRKNTAILKLGDKLTVGKQIFQVHFDENGKPFLKRIDENRERRAVAGNLGAVYAVSVTGSALTAFGIGIGSAEAKKNATKKSEVKKPAAVTKETPKAQQTATTVEPPKPIHPPQALEGPAALGAALGLAAFRARSNSKVDFSQRQIRRERINPKIGDLVELDKKGEAKVLFASKFEKAVAVNMGKKPLYLFFGDREDGSEKKLNPGESVQVESGDSIRVDRKGKLGKVKIGDYRLSDADLDVHLFKPEKKQNEKLPVIDAASSDRFFSQLPDGTVLDFKKDKDLKLYFVTPIASVKDVYVRRTESSNVEKAYTGNGMVVILGGETLAVGEGKKPIAIISKDKDSFFKSRVKFNSLTERLEENGEVVISLPGFQPIYLTKSPEYVNVNLSRSIDKVETQSVGGERWLSDDYGYFGKTKIRVTNQRGERKIIYVMATGEVRIYDHEPVKLESPRQAPRAPEAGIAKLPPGVPTAKPADQTMIIPAVTQLEESDNTLIANPATSDIKGRGPKGGGNSGGSAAFTIAALIGVKTLFGVDLRSAQAHQVETKDTVAQVVEAFESFDPASMAAGGLLLAGAIAIALGVSKKGLLSSKNQPIYASDGDGITWGIGTEEVANKTGKKIYTGDIIDVRQVNEFQWRVDLHILDFRGDPKGRASGITKKGSILTFIHSQEAQWLGIISPDGKLTGSQYVPVWKETSISSDGTKTDKRKVRIRNIPEVQEDGGRVVKSPLPLEAVETDRRTLRQKVRRFFIEDEGAVSIPNMIGGIVNRLSRPGDPTKMTLSELAAAGILTNKPGQDLVVTMPTRDSNIVKERYTSNGDFRDGVVDNQGNVYYNVAGHETPQHLRNENPVPQILIPGFGGAPFYLAKFPQGEFIFSKSKPGYRLVVQDEAGVPLSVAETFLGNEKYQYVNVTDRSSIKVISGLPAANITTRVILIPKIESPPSDRGQGGHLAPPSQAAPIAPPPPPVPAPHRAQWRPPARLPEVWSVGTGTAQIKLHPLAQGEAVLFGKQGGTAPTPEQLSGAAYSTVLDPNMKFSGHHFRIVGTADRQYPYEIVGVHRTNPITVHVSEGPALFTKRSVDGKEPIKISAAVRNLRIEIEGGTVLKFAIGGEESPVPIPSAQRVTSSPAPVGSARESRQPLTSAPLPTASTGSAAPRSTSMTGNVGSVSGGLRMTSGSFAAAAGEVAPEVTRTSSGVADHRVPNVTSPSARTSGLREMGGSVSRERLPTLDEGMKSIGRIDYTPREGGQFRIFSSDPLKIKRFKGPEEQFDCYRFIIVEPGDRIFSQSNEELMVIPGGKAETPAPTFTSPSVQAPQAPQTVTVGGQSAPLRFDIRTSGLNELLRMSPMVANDPPRQIFIGSIHEVSIGYALKVPKGEKTPVNVFVLENKGNVPLNYSAPVNERGQIDVYAPVNLDPKLTRTIQPGKTAYLIPGNTIDFLLPPDGKTGVAIAERFTIPQPTNTPLVRSEIDALPTAIIPTAIIPGRAAQAVNKPIVLEGSKTLKLERGKTVEVEVPGSVHKQRDGVGSVSVITTDDGRVIVTNHSSKYLTVVSGTVEVNHTDKSFTVLPGEVVQTSSNKERVFRLHDPSVDREASRTGAIQTGSAKLSDAPLEVGADGKLPAGFVKLRSLGNGIDVILAKDGSAYLLRVKDSPSSRGDGFVEDREGKSVYLSKGKLVEVEPGKIIYGAFQGGKKLIAEHLAADTRRQMLPRMFGEIPLIALDYDSSISVKVPLIRQNNVEEADIADPTPHLIIDKTNENGMERTVTNLSNQRLSVYRAVGEVTSHDPDYVASGVSLYPGEKVVLRDGDKIRRNLGPSAVQVDVFQLRIRGEKAEQIREERKEAIRLVEQEREERDRQVRDARRKAEEELRALERTRAQTISDLLSKQTLARTEEQRRDQQAAVAQRMAPILRDRDLLYIPAEGPFERPIDLNHYGFSGASKMTLTPHPDGSFTIGMELEPTIHSGGSKRLGCEIYDRDGKSMGRVNSEDGQNIKWFKVPADGWFVPPRDKPREDGKPRPVFVARIGDLQEGHKNVTPKARPVAQSIEDEGTVQKQNKLGTKVGQKHVVFGEDDLQDLDVTDASSMLLRKVGIRSGGITRHPADSSSRKAETATVQFVKNSRDQSPVLIHDPNGDLLGQYIPERESWEWSDRVHSGIYGDETVWTWMTPVGVEREFDYTNENGSRAIKLPAGSTVVPGKENDKAIHIAEPGKYKVATAQERAEKATRVLASESANAVQKTYPMVTEPRNVMKIGEGQKMLEPAPVGTQESRQAETPGVGWSGSRRFYFARYLPDGSGRVEVKLFVPKADRVPPITGTVYDEFGRQKTVKGQVTDEHYDNPQLSPLESDPDYQGKRWRIILNPGESFVPSHPGIQAVFAGRMKQTDLGDGILVKTYSNGRKTLMVEKGSSPQVILRYNSETEERAVEVVEPGTTFELEAGDSFTHNYDGKAYQIEVPEGSGDVPLRVVEKKKS